MLDRSGFAACSTLRGLQGSRSGNDDKSRCNGNGRILLNCEQQDRNHGSALTPPRATSQEWEGNRRTGHHCLCRPLPSPLPVLARGTQPWRISPPPVAVSGLFCRNPFNRCSHPLDGCGSRNRTCRDGTKRSDSDPTFDANRDDALERGFGLDYRLANRSASAPPRSGFRM